LQLFTKYWDFLPAKTLAATTIAPSKLFDYQNNHCLKKIWHSIWLSLTGDRLNTGFKK